MKSTAKSGYATYNSQRVEITLKTSKENTFLVFNSEAAEYDTLLEAMTDLAAKNEAVCKEILKKHKSFESSIKPKKNKD